MHLHDTDPEVRRRQLAVYAAMTPDERIALSFQMSEAMRSITIEGIRARHPELTQGEAEAAYVRLLHPHLPPGRIGGAAQR